MTQIEIAKSQRLIFKKEIILAMTLLNYMQMQILLHRLKHLHIENQLLE